MPKAKYLLLGLIVVLIGIRLALPYIAKHRINQSLRESPDYSGYVEDVSMGLIRGAFNLNGLHFRDKAESAVLYLPRLTTYVAWSALFHRKLILAVHFQQPRLALRLPEAMNLLKQTPEKTKEAAEKVAPGAPKPTLAQTLKKLPHFRIDSIAIKDGQIKITETEPKPDQIVWIREIEFEAVNLTNSHKISKSLFASSEMRFKTNDLGEGSVRTIFNPVTEVPTFELHAQLTDIHLGDLNPFFRHQFGLTVDTGTFSMYTEAAAAKGAFQGYVKPVIKNLQVANPSKHKPLKAIKKAVVQLVANVFQNSKEELSSRLPVEGRFENPHVGIVPAILTVLSNAISSSIRPSLEGQPTLKRVRQDADEIKKK